MAEKKEVSIRENGREAVIVRTSVIGIIANLFLAGFKAAVGLISHSIAIVLDAVNNLSDALSSVITIIGAKLAGRKADAKHPLGHGRIEYLSAMVVSAIVLYAGITSLIESVKKIISPEEADYSAVTLIILASAVAVKLLLGRFVKKKGEEVNSASLVASGSDALFDAILSSSVLLSAIIFLTTGLGLEAYVGVLISAFIIKSGIEMMRETVDQLVGVRIDRDVLGSIRETILEEEQVSGVYDLILHSYGPDRYVGSVHVEIPDTMTADDIDDLERRIAARVYEKNNILLTGIGIYAVNTKDDAVKEIRSKLTSIVMSHEGVVQLHGFSVDQEKKHIHFDVILDFALPDRQAVFRDICREVQEAFPAYQILPVLDLDF